MDLTADIKKKLRKRTEESQTGGGYSNFRFVIEDDAIKAPLASQGERAAEVLDSFILEPGADFINIHANVKEFDLNEEANDTEGSDGITTTFEGVFDGDEVAIRNLINQYKINGRPVYALVDQCHNQRTYIFGLGKCCPAKLKIGYKGGKANTDTKGFPFKITVEGDGLVPIYRGVGSISRELPVPVDTSAIDVSAGTATYVLPENTKATEITALNNAVAGHVYTLKWDSSTTHSAIKDGAVFHLTAAFAPKKGAMLQLRAIKANEFVETGRHIPNP